MQTLKNLFAFGRLATLSFVAMFAAGCATPNVDLASSRQLDVEIENSEMATLSEVEIVEKPDGGAWVRGIMTHRPEDVGTLKGHVHVEVWESEKRISTTKVSYRHRVMGTVARRMTFAAHLPDTPSDNAKIIVKHHDARHAGQLQDLIEGENQ